VCYDELKYDLEKQIEEILLFIKKKKIVEDEIKCFVIYNNELNATVKKIDNNSFVIEITKVFLEELCLQHTFLENLIELESKKIFDIWMKFILFHEVAHILRNHFKVNKKHEFHEFNLSNHISDRVYFELDADKFATAMLIPFLAHEPKRIDDMMESSAYLFHILFMFNRQSSGSESNYPHPFTRLMFFYTNIVSISKKYEQLKLEITMDEAFDKIEKLLLLNQDIYDEKLIESSINFTHILKSYNEFLDKNKEILVNDLKKG
jgi:hypothetical protein